MRGLFPEYVLVIWSEYGRWRTVSRTCIEVGVGRQLQSTRVIINTQYFGRDRHYEGNGHCFTVKTNTIYGL